MQVYPGTEQPKLEKLEIDGYRETLFHMFSHTGTHMDAPYHLLKEAKKLDEMPIDAFIGDAAVITVPQGVRLMGKDMLKGVEGAEFVLFNTGWGARWGQKDYFTDFPVLSFEAAEYLAGLGLKGVGIDAVSVDEVSMTELPIHRILLGAGMVIVENLAWLDTLPVRVRFHALPLFYKDADGSPVRAFAQV